MPRQVRLDAPGVLHHVMARAILAYIWLRYLGRSGNDLAKAFGVSPQSLYVSSSRMEGDDLIREL